MARVRKPRDLFNSHTTRMAHCYASGSARYLSVHAVLGGAIELAWLKRAIAWCEDGNV
jgi:hypothetical protein